MNESFNNGKAEGKAEGLAEGEAKGKAEGLAEGEAKGREEGLAEGKMQVAQNLLRLGLPLVQVSEATGLSEEQLANLL